MNDKLTKRIQDLKVEFAAGQKMVAELDGKKADLTRNLLRISGAIQVLEELVADDTRSPDDDTGEGRQEMSVAPAVDSAVALIPQRL